MSDSTVVTKVSPYPIGSAPINQLESSKPCCRQSVGGVEASFVPLTYFHTCPLLISNVPGEVPAGWADARQLPARSLSRLGFASSSDAPGGSPTVGQGNPRP